MKSEDIRVGQERSGFVLRQTALLPEINATLYRFEHGRTGARYIHLATADDNNLFAVGFRTPPGDSTGVAHILEHTALCGSRRYPVRDPFFSMIKRSLNSFMNAMTAADWTLYPFSSQNEKDFYNLMGVYLDAAFFPLLREQAFLQEGWRLEFEEPTSPESPLVYKGVVYNEMKGAMADPASLLEQRLCEALYPTTTYGKNSGGEPAEIPALTWEGLRAFHAMCYHPSNAYFFTYGDLPVDRHLAVIEAEALRGFDRLEADTSVPDEERLLAPRRIVATRPLEPGESPEGKAMVQVGWLNGRVTDSFHRVAMDLLEALLVGTPAAPLHKALLDSKLGTNLAPGSGYNRENRETSFSVGLQGTESERTEPIEGLILETLDRLSREGFPPERIEAVLHRLEFDHREVRGDHYPYALSLLSRLMSPWIHGGDPVSALALGEDLARIRQEVGRGPFFQELIRRELLENPHRVTLTLRPDAELAQRQEAEVRSRLAQIRAGLTKGQEEALVAQARELESAQEAVEDLSCLPGLGLTDIPAEERPVSTVAGTVNEVPVHWFEQPTNGIGYFLAFAEAGDVGEELAPYLPLFCALWSQVGAGGFTYVEMAERMEAATGGVLAGTALLERPDGPEVFRALVEFRSKALVRNQPRMFEVLGDLVTAPDFTDLRRLHTVIGQVKANLENSIPMAGHRYAARVASASLTPSSRLRERWSGVEHIRFVRGLAELKPEGLADASQRFQSLARHLLAKARLCCGVTGEGPTFEEVRNSLGSFLAGLDGAGAGPGAEAPRVAPSPAPARVGLATSVPVCYTARVFPCVPYTHPDSAGLLVLAKLLRANFLHREIREKGGAYGGMASYDPEGGLFSLLSYRDPHLARTFRVYEDAARWAATGDFGAEEVKEAILGVFGDLDRPLSPAGKGERELGNHLQGLTQEMRQGLRRGALATDRDLLKGLAERYLRDGWSRSAVAAVASEEALKRANRELGEDRLVLEKL